MPTIPVFDGHNDTLLAIYQQQPAGSRSFFERHTDGHIDLPRARAGGFAGGFFAIHMPADPAAPAPPPLDPATTPPGALPSLPLPLEFAYAQRVVAQMAASLFRIEEESGGALHVVRTAREIQSCIEGGSIAAILHFEGAEAIDPDFHSLDIFYRAGLRSIGIVWSRSNRYAHGVPLFFGHSPDTGPGLTEDGKRLVDACNRKKIMVDLSHLNERGFWDVAERTTAPLVATHSNAWSLSSHCRNLTDAQLDAIGQSGGMVGLNFAVAFLRDDGKRDADTPLEVMVRHIDALVDRVGIDGVGLGSDFDGALISQEIGDVTGLPRLLDALQAHGYDESSLRKIAYENWIRLLAATWGE